MKRLFICTLILSMAFLLQSWSLFKIFRKNVGPENGFVWYETKENGLIGAVDKNENELLPCQFKAIELSNDWKDGNATNDYLWQLKWNVVDKHGDKLEIRLYIFDDGWRYYHTSNMRTEKTKVSNNNYNNVVIPYARNQKISTLFNRKDWRDWFVTRNAPSITKQHYFFVLISQYGCGIYTENGEAIIPIERQAGLIHACEQDGRAWYMYDNTICDAHGTEIFRYDDNFVAWKNINNSKWFQREYQELVDEYKWYGGFDDQIIYDAEKGFGSLQEKNLDDMYEGLYIKFTGIKLSSNSSSFDVQPSGNNNRAKLINLRTYKQSSGSVYPSNGYYGGGQFYGGGQYMPTPNNEMSTYDNGSNSNPGLSAAQYQQNYNGYEDIVKGIFRTFEITGSDMPYAARLMNMQTLRDTQKQMYDTRQEAASHGITIPQSYYETARP